jgi:glycerophosphoryl diester phosphodiesterase
VVVAVITFAHRGARLEEPENTIPAFRRALELGATGIETDVWLSADGEVVCAHDPVVTRGLRRRKLASTTAD